MIFSLLVLSFGIFAIRIRTLRGLKYGSHLTVAFLFAFLFISHFIVQTVEDKIIDSQKEKLLGYAPSYALVLEKLEHENLSDLTSSDDPSYLKMIDFEINWLKANPFVSDIYTMKKRSTGEVYLMVDSETDYDHDSKITGERESRTAIGETYSKQLKEIDDAFQGHNGFTLHPYSDRWGDWVSAFVPMRDKSGKVDAILGIDFNSEVFLKEIINARRLVILCLLLLYSLIVSTVVFTSRLLARNKQLIEALKTVDEAVKTKSQFLANMSHEIRTPMNGVIGMTNLLLSSITDPVNVERLKVIQSCGNSLLEVINDVLDFSKLEIDKVEFENKPFSLRAMVSETVELFSGSASEKGISLSYSPSLETPDWIYGDTTRLRQILNNLISNAIKFTEIGKVSIESYGKKLPDGSWEVQFSVRDTGIGIPKDVQDKLFQSFSQVDASTTRKFGGTGLGLAICKGLCEKMGGRIWIESEPGKGSVFSFTFHAAPAETPQMEPSSNPFSSFDTEMAKKFPLNILIVEDNRINQMVVVGLLAKLGYNTQVANNGKEALTCLERAYYDLIFMDCHMPEMDGFEATKQIVQKYKGNKAPHIVALTASAMAADIDRCYQSGMNGFVSKPITLPALVQVLEECERKKKKAA